MAEEEGEELGFEQKLERALSSRAQHFKDSSDTLTLGSVRRLLEKDLGLQKFALDPHKKFIREYLTKEQQGTDDGNTENATADVEKDVNLSKEETTELSKQHETKNGTKDSGPEDEKLMKDSPIMGVLTSKSEFGTHGSTVDESRIKKAVWKRADYFLANSENITLGGVRRLLEEDLGLDKNALNSFKKFVRQEIDQVLNSPRSAKSAKDVKKKTSESSKPAKDVKQKASKSSQTKKSEKVSSEEESSGGESDEPNSEVKPQRKAAAKPKGANSKGPKKRKISEDNDHNVSGKKQKKIAKSEIEKEENASDEDECTSQDDKSQSSTGKQALRAKLANSYGKRIDKLKAVIKSCGMSVPPTIYKKSKQVPDDEREAFIFEELVGILSKEGLSESPTEKDIKDCRKRKERARELEGIDTSNIISSSRRRSSASFVSPPKPAISSINEKTKAKDKKKKEASDNEINDNNEEEKEKEKAEKLENDVKEEKKDGEEEVEEEEEEEDEEDNEDDDEDDGDEEDEEFNGDDDEDSD